jgi:hypothetical protein
MSTVNWALTSQQFFLTEKYMRNIRKQSLELLLRDFGGQLPQRFNGNKIAFFLYFSLQQIYNYTHTHTHTHTHGELAHICYVKVCDSIFSVLTMVSFNVLDRVHLQS